MHRQGYERMLDDQAENKVGLILSGGGARAAYQVGVLRAIANVLPKESKNPFHVISGTSAGALNAVSLASHAPRFRTAVRLLEYVWKGISSEQIYHPNARNFMGSISRLLLPLLDSKKSDSPVALLNSAPLREFLTRVISLKRIQRHIDMGLLDAVSVTASNYSSGESVSFFQAMKGLEDWEGPHRKGMRAQLTLDHLMASSAIPILFPAVRIGTQFFGDGAIRQLAPTSTALHLGARRVLAIGVSGNKRAVATEEENPIQPSLSQILGHILNSAFVDTLDNDLEFLRHMNEVLPYVPPKALKSLNIRLNEVDLLEISPSNELNVMACEYYDELPENMRRYIREDSSGTLLSLLLFEPGFCNALWRLGYGDAMEQESRIIEFFHAE